MPHWTNQKGVKTQINSILDESDLLQHYNETQRIIQENLDSTSWKIWKKWRNFRLFLPTENKVRRYKHQKQNCEKWGD